MAINNAIITIFSTVAGAVAAAVATVYIQTYGFPSFEIKKETYFGNGKGKEISMSKLSGDFTTRASFSYVLKNCHLETQGEKAKVECQLISKNPKNKEYKGSVKGEGISKDGIAYIIYWGEYPSEKVKWPGVLILTLPRLGDLKGYWITEDTLSKGKFAFGSVNLFRK